MSVQTTDRPFLGTGSGLARDQVSRKFTGPIAAAVNLPQGSIAGALLTDPNPIAPVVRPFVGDGTMVALGFVMVGRDNTTGAQGDGAAIDVLAESGHIPDKNAGGANAIVAGDARKPAYGPDNGSCSKLAADGPCIGLILGIDSATGEPIILIDPIVATYLGGGSAPVLPGVASNVTSVKTAAYGAQFGDLVRYDPTGGAFPINLPPIAAWNKGFVVATKNNTTNATAVTATPNGAQTVDKGASLAMIASRQFTTFTSDGVSDWIIS